MLWTIFKAFVRIGICTIGGGSAEIPYMMELSGRYHWLTMEKLAAIIAVSECAPGPGGVSMSTGIGYQAAGIGGSIAAVLGICFPSLILMTMIAHFIEKFENSETLKAFFYGVRAAVCISIAWAVYRLLKISVIAEAGFQPEMAALYLIGIVLMRAKRTKKIHPIVWMALAAGAGILTGV